MNERIKTHLDDLFEGVPKTRQVSEMYEELLAGCLDKYADLTAGGMDEEEAYRQVIGGIGDVDELLGYVEKAEFIDFSEVAEKRKKKAFFTSAGICGYFLALAIFLFFMYLNRLEIGLILLVVFAGASTMLMVYGRMTNTLKYEKADDTLVEEMKVQMVSGKKADRMAKMAASSLWSLVVVFYLAVSLISGRWDITWMLFPFAAGVQNLVAAYFSPRARKKFYAGAFWCFVTTLYFVISFWSFAWQITWIIFPCAVAAQQAANLFLVWREEK